MRGTIVIVVEPLPEGVWLGTSPDLPGLICEMQTKEECIEEARKLVGELLMMTPPYDIGSGGTTPPDGKFQVW